MSALMMILSDVYRLFAALFDWRGRLRVLRGRARYDVACIANFETSALQSFIGWRARYRPFANGLRFGLGGVLGRSLLINSSAQDLASEAGRQVAKNQARSAIQRAAAAGARVVLFGAGTKRLFSAAELDGLRALNPRMIFTIGDNGTAWALLQDVFRAIEERGLRKDSAIAVLGPNGFLGSAVTQALEASGYRRLFLLSSRGDDPFAGVADVELVVACSHHHRVRLSADVLRRISHRAGAYVVDVCKPTNLSRRELARCGDVTKRQDAGNVHNADLRYVFALGANAVLRRVRLDRQTLYGCFAEAVALATLPVAELRRHDWLSVNDDAMDVVERLLPEVGFQSAPIANYGVIST